MDQKTKELVGIASAIAGHCQKCFSYHYNEARKLGIAEKDINEAMELAKAIRQAGDKGVDEFAEAIIKRKENQ
jgi:AhpD family alkylhydroperoxidase